jgi:hypothetical protein
MKGHLFEKTEVLAVNLSTRKQANKQINYEKDNLKTKLQARKIYGHCNMLCVTVRYSALAQRLYIQNIYQANKRVHYKKSSPS